MANGQGLAALAAGLGAGYLGAKQRNTDNARQAKIDTQNTEIHDARMDEIRQAKQQRIALADAVAPRSAQAGTVVGAPGSQEFYADAKQVTPELQQDRQIEADMRAEQAGAEPVTLAQAKPGFGVTAGSKGQISTQAPDLTALNSRDAKMARVVDATMATDPAKALTLENAAQTQKQNQVKFTQEQADYAAKLKKEGVFSALQRFRMGDATGAVKAFNADGDHQVVGEPVVTREDRDVPGVGKIPTYNAKVRLRGPDGTETEKTYNSHELSMQVMPYEKALELQRKGTDSDNKATYQSALIDAKTAALEAKTAAAAAKGGGVPTREERLRYTTLFSDAGRRIAESQKALSALQKDPVFMINAKKPGSQEAGELQSLRDTIQSHTEERSMYQGMLAGSRSAAPSLADARPTAKPAAKPAAPGTPGKPAVTADYSKLWN